MTYFSPKIKNRTWVLTPEGKLQMEVSVDSQVQVALTAYDGIGNPENQSEFLALTTGLANNYNKERVTNVVKKSQQNLINNRVITDLTISPTRLTIDNITVRINVVDSAGNKQQINWDNIE